MVISEIVTLFFYIISIAFLPEYFGNVSYHAEEIRVFADRLG